MIVKTFFFLCHTVNAIHPGYGFLSENPQFAEACKQNGITFIGPQPSQLEAFGNKTSARAIAIENNVPVVPGTEGMVKAKSSSHV